MYVVPHPLNDRRERRTRREYSAYPRRPQSRDVNVWNDATAEDDDVVGAPPPQLIDDGRKKGVVRSAHDRQPDRIHVLLNGGIRNHFGGLMQPRIDNLQARVAQRPRNHLCATVVTVEPRLRNEDAGHAGRLRSGRHASPILVRIAVGIRVLAIGAVVIVVIVVVLRKLG